MCGDRGIERDIVMRFKVRRRKEYLERLGKLTNCWSRHTVFMEAYNLRGLGLGGETLNPKSQTLSSKP